MLNPLLRRRFQRHLQTKEEAYRQQQQTYLDLRRQLKNTRLGEAIGLERLRDLDLFLRHVPSQTYEDFAPYIMRMADGSRGEMFAGPVRSFGLTSGTTGKHGKEIPYNDAMLKLFFTSRSFTVANVAHLEPQFNPLKFATLSIAGPKTVFERNGISYGYISGILDAMVPWYLKRNMYPKDKSYMQADFTAKVEHLYRETRKVDLRAITGVPTVVLEFLRGVVELAGVDDIHQVWPNLRYIVYGGSDIAPIKAGFDRLGSKAFDFIGIYAASECPVALPYESWQGSSRYLLNPGLVYGFRDSESGLIGSIADVALDKTYTIVPSAPNGFLQYNLRDQIRFVSLDPLVFNVIGREDSALNLATEKVTESSLADILTQVCNDHEIKAEHFMVLPYTTGLGQGYRFVVFSDHGQGPRFSHALDQAIQSLHTDYRENRDDGVLLPAKVEFRQAESIGQAIRINADRGQLKLRRIFRSQDDFLEYEKKMRL